MFTRERIRNILVTLGAVAIFLAIMPYSHSRRVSDGSDAMREHLKANPDDMPSDELYRFGWAGSPIFQYHSVKHLVQRPGGYVNERATNWSIGWFSWSSLTLAIGVALVLTARRVPVRPCTEVRTGQAGVTEG